jgi:hypothetical protein
MEDDFCQFTELRWKSRCVSGAESTEVQNGLFGVRDVDSDQSFSFIFNFRVSNLFLKVVDEVVELGLRWESQAKNHSLTKNWRK